MFWKGSLCGRACGFQQGRHAGGWKGPLHEPPGSLAVEPSLKEECVGGKRVSPLGSGLRERTEGERRRRERREVAEGKMYRCGALRLDRRMGTLRRFRQTDSQSSGKRW